MRSLSSQATSPRPGIGGSVARVPTLRKTWAPPACGRRRRRWCPSSLGAGEAGLAVDRERSSVSSSDFVELSTQPSMSWSLRATTAAKSTTTVAGRHAIGARRAGEMSDASRRPHRLRRAASPIEARPADLVLLDDGDSLAVIDEIPGDARAGLAGADHDGVEPFGLLRCHPPIVARSLSALFGRCDDVGVRKSTKEPRK